MITCIIKHWKIYEVIRQCKPKMITQKPTQHMKKFMETAKVTKIGAKTIYRV